MDEKSLERAMTSDGDRLVVLPIRYPVLWNFYQKARDSFWLPREVNLSVDIDHWNERLTDGERHALSRVLAFFATADAIVADNLVERFSQEVPIMEAKYFYGFQGMIENIHAETYAMILHHLIPNDSERNSILKDTVEVSSIARKNEWAKKWLLDRGRSLKERLVAFACVEGIFFSASFAVIYWFKAKNLLPGLCHSNDLISRDEGLHTDFACALLRHLGEPPDPAVVTSIVAEAVEAELGFVGDALSRPLVGMSPLRMSEYVRFVADQLLRALGYAAFYGVSNPFPLMTMASMPGRTNFFERRNTDYRLSATSHGAAGREVFTRDAFAR